MRLHIRLQTLVAISLGLSLILGTPGQGQRAVSAALPEAAPEPVIPLSWTLADEIPFATLAAPPAAQTEEHTIRLKSREFQPGPADDAALQDWAARGPERVHLLIQLDYIPRARAKAELQGRGLSLLAYVPDYAWIASLPAQDAAATLDWPGVTWIGELTVDDKLAPDIREGRWAEYNLAPDGTAAVYVLLHPDEALETGRALAAAHAGIVTGEAVGIRMLMVELPQSEVYALAAEDAVQWVEPAAPPLRGANDGLRAQIGVDILHADPYNLDGTGIDVLVYDSGQVGNHTDFGTRLTHGDTDTVSEHSTHVAGTVGGDGSNSAAQGGSALQWQGMAPNADLISYGTAYPAGTTVIFYARVPDIEDDWADAQNVYGADLGTASLGSNVYDNYPSQCASLLGKYGAASVLIDQIVRGGNSAVGLGDKYITTWAAGNERGSSSSYCGSSYGTTTPPAGAKNPIHVGGSNTNNNTQYVHTSWGPTEDGRLKPIVTAGACQTSGDFAITSTDNNPLNGYTTMCGTSMATPAVAGGIALMLQHYRDVYNTSGTFWPSTAKAILMQTAVDFGNPGPDYQWGYGQVDIHAAVDLISRRAFRQDNVGAGQVDVYSLIVPEEGAPLTVSLAWDDYEATLNANPTLINNLDLELVAPGGTIWRPWVLDPGHPANNATRGVDNRNNQEQVQVPAPEIGTWLVRVRGTTVPQGPQDYALACEGCVAVDVGVCQETVASTALAQDGISDRDEAGPPAIDAEPGEEVLAGPQVVLSEGERWQRALEAGIPAGLALQGMNTEDGTWVPQAPGPYVFGSPDPAAQARATAMREAWSAFEAARQAGPEALRALRKTLPPEVLDLVDDEMAELQEQWADEAAPLPDTGPVSEAEEQAAQEALAQAEAAARAVALADRSDPAEGGARGESQAPSAPLDVGAAADRTVGAGCTHATIAAAIAAAGPGDRLLIEGGVTFHEAVVVDKNLTLQGGYAGCASGSSAPTTIDAGGSGTVVTIASGLIVTLEHLDVINGNAIGTATQEGGGIELARGTGSGTLRMTDVRVYGNSAVWGGGIWVGPNAEVIGSGVQVYDNTATTYGGGVRLYGGRMTLSSSNVYSNAAPYGGGVFGTLENTYAPSLQLPSAVDVSDNRALSGAGLGGGVYMRQGTISIADCSDIRDNEAILGGGAYVVTSTLTIDGACSEIEDNVATSHGGGVFAQGSTINLDDQAELLGNDAGGSGGGAYLDGGGLWTDKASIRANTAAGYGGGAYATNGARVDMDLGTYTCLGVRCSRLANNTASGNYGGGIYAHGGSGVYLDNVFVESNVALLGGGIYASGSGVYLNSNVLARNNATGTAGDAVRLISGSTLSGSGNTIAYNDAGGASTGQAIGVSTSDLSLSCSIIWGHSSSINSASEDVSYSDVQGGYAGTANIAVNPLFVSFTRGDYHLRTTSPAIDRCLNGPSVDMDGELRPIVRASGASTYDMGADEVAGADRVGVNGPCSYATIQQAIHAAADGDTVRVAAGTYFENVDIGGKSITVEGGYDAACTTLGTAKSRIEGSAGSGSTVDVTGGTVTLRNLQVAWGSGIGAGIDAEGNAEVTLDATEVLHNHGTYGGGIYVAPGSTVTADNDSDVHANTATVHGGGMRVWGRFYGDDTQSDFYYNCAPHGGGISVPGGVLELAGPDTYGNIAADAAGQGGGIHVTAGGTVSLTNGAWVFAANQAYNGAGIYVDDAALYLAGGNTRFSANQAAHDGGAVYLANGSTLRSSGAQIGYAVSGQANEAQRGAGIFAEGSTVSFSGAIVNNVASSAGAGIYASDSTLNLSGATLGGTGTYDPNVVGVNGGGMYLVDGTQATLDQTTVVSNEFQAAGVNHGGGAYVTGGSVLTMTGSLIAYHEAPSTSTGRGAGIYLSDSTVTLRNSQVVSNTAGANGGAVRMWGTSTLRAEAGSSISGNESLSGEGGAVAATGTATIDVSGTVLAHNSAGTVGGAIYQEGAESALEVRNSLLHGNSSADPSGAAIRVAAGSLTVMHVTLAGNLGGPAVSSGAASSSVSNSIAWGNPLGGFAGTFGSHSCNIDQSGTVGTNVDPQFVAPGTDHHLQGSSPAVDSCGSGLAVDLDGSPRPYGAGYDMGAYEYYPEVIYLPVVLRND